MPPQDRPQPRLLRVREGALLGGVATGLAEHLNVPVRTVRIIFVVLALLGGLGVVAYAAFWVLVPNAAPGAASGAPDPVSVWPFAGVVALLAGAYLLVLRERPQPWAAPVLFAGLGGALIWWQSDHRDEQSRSARAFRLGLGALLFVVGAVLFLAAQVGLGELLSAVAALLVVLAGVAVLASPFILRLQRERDQERAERIATRERADIATHLHDSVLQTLTLIQAQAEDPEAVFRLARAEERGLRQWLYGRTERQGSPADLGAQVQAAASEVEQLHAAVIEVVAVGAAPAGTPQLDAVVAATREAMLNAARHSHDPDPIRVFLNAGPDSVELYVRDRGVGFDPNATRSDRAGVRESIVGRITRLGGTASVRSTPGHGTEVHVVMPLGERNAGQATRSGVQAS